jgi:hypothetical protein
MPKAVQGKKQDDRVVFLKGELQDAAMQCALILKNQTGYKRADGCPEPLLSGNSLRLK